MILSARCASMAQLILNPLSRLQNKLNDESGGPGNVFRPACYLKQKGREKGWKKSEWPLLGSVQWEKICENDTGGKDFRDVSWGSLLQEP